MTALGSSRVWATTGQGIFTEIYWPAVDQPQVKDLGFLIGGTGWWQEVKRAGTYTLSTPEPGLMLPTIVHAGRDQAYQLTLRPVVDPDHDALLIDYELTGEGVRLYPLLAPHLGISQITPERMAGARGGQPWVDRPGGPGHVRQRQQRFPVPARPARVHPRRSRLRGRHGRDRLQPPSVDDPDPRSGRARGGHPDRGAGGGLRRSPWGSATARTRPGPRRRRAWTPATTRRPRRSPGAGEPGRRASPCPGRISWRRRGQPDLPGWPTRSGVGGGAADPRRSAASGAYVAGLAIPWTTATSPAATTWCGAGTPGRPARSRRPGPRRRGDRAR